MRRIRCAIVDDEPLALKLIESFISRTPFLQLEASFSDPVEAMDSLRANPVELVFLDIQMPDMDGMELSHVIPPTTRIIFTTAFREYAFDSYEVSAIDFLLKPIRYYKFLRAAEKARDWFEMKAAPAVSDIFIRVDGELRRIEFDDILYVEGMKDYVRFYLRNNDRSLITHLTMKSVEETLPPERFMRISRSHIISLDNIRTVDRNMCVYIGDTILRVTDMFRPSFEAFLQQRLAR